MGKVFVFDHSRCNGCRNCQLACKDEHVDAAWPPYAAPQPDTGQFWLKLEEKVRGQVPKVKVSYTVRLCQHCDDAPCIAAATAAGYPKAVYKRDDGLVIVDPVESRGLVGLELSCPYGAIFYNEKLDIPQKCTGCAHLVDAGEIPHCVDVCPHGALQFGEEEDFAEVLAQAGSLDGSNPMDSPRVFYLNKPQRFIAGTVIDPEADEVIIGAKVTAENTATGELSSIVTDDFGDFWLDPVEAADWRVYFESEGYMNRVMETSTVEEDINLGPVGLYRYEG